MTGVILSFDPSRLYGLIGAQERRTNVFFHLSGVRPDQLGRQYPLAESLGTWVNFELVPGISGSEMAAMDVTPVIPPPPINLATHREKSTVIRWVPNLQIGFAQRQSGDWISFSATDVISEGVETLTIGTKLWHAVAFKPKHRNGDVFDPSKPIIQRVDSKHVVKATEIEIFMPEASTGESWPPKNTTVLEREVIDAPKSVLLSDKFRDIPLKRLGIRPRA